LPQNSPFWQPEFGQLADRFSQMRYPVVSLLLIAAVGAWAQTPTIDSLRSVVESTQDDSIRIRAYLSLSTAHNFRDLSKSRQYLTEARSLGEERKWDWAIGMSLVNFGFVYALEGDFTSAIRYGNQALPVLNRLPDSLYVSTVLNNLGDYHLELGHYDEAYLNFTEAFRKARKQRDTLIQLVALHNVGKVFKELGQYDRARDHFNASLNISRQIEDSIGEAYYLLESGDVLYRKARYDSALSVLRKALHTERRTRALEIEPRTLNLIADTYLELGRYADSRAYYDSALAIHQKNNNAFGRAQSTLGISNMLIRQKKYKEAEEALRRSLELSRSMNAMTIERECYALLAQAKEQLKQYGEALEYYKRSREIDQEIFSQEMLEKLSSEQIRFETEARDFQIAQLNRLEEAQRQVIEREVFIRNILIILIAVIVILLFTVYRSGRRRRKINQLLVEHQAELVKRQEELVQLNQVKDKFFSIISHDLRSPVNAMGAILEMVEKGQVTAGEFPALAKELRNQFTHTKSLLNNLLDWALLQMDKLTLQPVAIDLREMVNENFRLMKSLYSKAIDMQNGIVPETMAYGDLNTINLVIRNLLLNAVKFTAGGGYVRVTAEDKGSEWEVTVADNGIGISEEAQRQLFDRTALYSTRGTAEEKGTGLGLILCKEFVERNGGRIRVESAPGKGSLFSFTVRKSVPAGNSQA
jgi:signal transduction histidine kinase